MAKTEGAKDIRFSPEWCFDDEKMNLIMEEENARTLEAFPNCQLLANSAPLPPGYGRQKLIKTVSSILEGEGHIKPCSNRPSSRAKRADTLAAILANLTLCLGATETTLDKHIGTGMRDEETNAKKQESGYLESRPWVYYSRNKGHYEAYAINSNFSQGEMILLIDSMTKAGLLIHEKAEAATRGAGQSSRFRPTQEMLTLLCLHSAKIEALAFNRSVFIIKDTYKRIIPKPRNLTKEKSSQIESIRRQAQRISDFVSWQDVKIINNECKDITINVLTESIKLRNEQRKKRQNRELGLPELESEQELTECCQQISALALKQKVNLYRVFNNDSLKQGGRFYGHWLQCVNKGWRKWAVINGRQTVALDYTAIHLHILYALENITAPNGDLYTLSDIENFDRDVAKVMALIVINAKGRNSATLAMLHHSEDEGWNLSDDQIEKYLNAFVEKHKALRQYFFSSFGPRAQNIDSQIAERVLCKLMNQNIGCIPIHDGFLVGVQDKNALASAMDEAAREVIGRTIPWKQEH